MITSSSKYWKDMNCVLEKPSQNCSFYVSENGPPSFDDLPKGISCAIYHPLHLDGNVGNRPDKEIEEDIISFIKTHDEGDNGNVTELTQESLQRLFSTPSVMAILRKDNKIIGTMISPIFRVKYKRVNRKPLNILSSYSTFLCVDKLYRKQGLAMALIRSIMQEGFQRYGINHGYYMTFNKHHNINTSIESWYRPINLKKSKQAGFDLESFGNSAVKQRLAYHVCKPTLLPVKATLKSYDLVQKILRQRYEGNFCLAPTYKEFGWLCNCFDIYTVGDYGLFMLFPITSYIYRTKQRVRNGHLSLMIGDVLSHVLWAANETNYDLVYGWCCGDVTTERVTNVKGIITAAETQLELYNTTTPIPPNNMFVPLF